MLRDTGEAGLSTATRRTGIEIEAALQLLTIEDLLTGKTVDRPRPHEVPEAF